MMLAIAALFFLVGCTKNNQQNDSNNLTAEKAFKEKVKQRDLKIAEIKANYQGRNTNTQSPARENAGTCNKVVICHKGKYISVNKNAVAAHLAHGDQLTCCTTSCINQSAELLNSGPFEWYYDSYANDCFDIQHHGGAWVSIGYAHGNIAAEAFTHHGMTHYFVYSYDHHNDTYTCDAEVTQSEYECARVYLQSYIAANSCIPDLCDLL